jgi:PAS domain S-box-containing protein
MNNSSNGTAAASENVGSPSVATDVLQIRAFADFFPQLAWSCLPDGYCDYLNRRWVEYTGVPEARHHGRGWLDAVYPDDRARTAVVWDAFVAGRADYDVDYRLRRHDGVYRWFKTRGVLVRSPDGKPVRVFGTTTDVDDQMRAEERDRESRERLEAALAASGTGTFRWDIRTNALDWDEQLDRLFGLPPGRTVRSLDKFVELVHPDDREGVLERCRRCKDEGADFAMEFRVVWPDGSVRWLDDRGRTFRDPAGRPEYMTGACVDITERKRADELLRELDERAAFVKAASGVGFWYCDLPFDELRWDERVKEHFHLAPDSRVTIETFYSRLHPDDREPTRRAIGRSIADREQYDVHYRTVHPATGAEKWVRAIGRTFNGADGMPRRFDGVTIDVTDRFKAQEELRESEARLRSVTEAARVGLVVVDQEHRYRFTNRAYAEVLGLPSSDVVGLRVADVLAPVYEEQIRPRLDRAFAGERVSYELKLPALPGGAPRFCAVAYEPRTEPSGERIVVVVIVDITERLRAEEHLREADRRKDEFLALLAHELRNPLAPLRNGLQVMRLSGGSGEAADRARGMMERQLSHLVRLVDDLLDVSRISRNKMELRRERVLLSDVVSAAVETARPAIDHAGHEFTVALPGEPVHLDADLTRLAQVFSNLLTNAAKYTEPGGRISLSAEPRGGGVVVTVEDTGIGIPPEALPRIFDMFSQVDRSIERRTGGLGIGLALVKGLVEMHGGSVSAASGGVGSTFQVTLPVVDGPRNRDEPGDDDAAVGQRGPARRILVVDDNRDSAGSMATMLQLLGHEVRVAHDGVQAIEEAEAFLPELVLMDVGMPRMNGYDATRRIRERPWGKSVTVVALTGWGQDGDRTQSRAAGCDGHLVKPVHLNDLAAFVDRQPPG